LDVGLALLARGSFQTQVCARAGDDARSPLLPTD
jgi:hypothetical protein